jgi:hypothetical protein
MRSRRERKGQFSCLQVEKNNPQKLFDHEHEMDFESLGFPSGD